MRNGKVPRDKQQDGSPGRRTNANWGSVSLSPPPAAIPPPRMRRFSNRLPAIQCGDSDNSESAMTEQLCQRQQRLYRKNSDIDSDAPWGSEEELDLEMGGNVPSRSPRQLPRSPLKRSPPRALCSSYRSYLQEKPLQASCLTAMLLMAAGDALAQAVEATALGDRAGALTGEPRRTALMMSYSATIFMPMYFLLYSMMARACASRDPLARPLSVVRQSLLVMAAGAPADALLLLAVPQVAPASSSRPSTLYLSSPQASEACQRDERQPRTLRTRARACAHAFQSYDSPCIDGLSL